VIGKMTLATSPCSYLSYRWSPVVLPPSLLRVTVCPLEAGAAPGFRRRRRS
jgi:hypothetical protein